MRLPTAPSPNAPAHEHVPFSLEESLSLPTGNDASSDREFLDFYAAFLRDRYDSARVARTAKVQVQAEDARRSWTILIDTLAFALALAALIALCYRLHASLQTMGF